MSRTNKQSDARDQLEAQAMDLLHAHAQGVEGADSVYIITPSTLADILEQYREQVKEEIVEALHNTLEDLE